MEPNQVKSLYTASWSCFENCRLQAEFQIYISSSAAAKGSRRSLWVPESHWVAKCFSIWLLVRNLLWCLLKSWPEHPQLKFADIRNQKQSAFLSIFDLLADIFWRWKAFGLTSQERKPPIPRQLLHGPWQRAQTMSTSFEHDLQHWDSEESGNSHDSIHSGLVDETTSH